MIAPHPDRSRTVLAKPTNRNRRRMLALAVAMSLGAAACGSGSDTPELGATSTSADTTAVDPSITEGSPNEAAPENLFPDVNVQNITDGSQVNLKEELQGGDLPILLWFFAPH